MKAEGGSGFDRAVRDNGPYPAGIGPDGAGPYRRFVKAKVKVNENLEAGTGRLGEASVPARRPYRRGVRADGAFLVEERVGRW